jgi:hypothetical protein
MDLSGHVPWWEIFNVMVQLVMMKRDAIVTNFEVSPLCL